MKKRILLIVAFTFVLKVANAQWVQTHGPYFGSTYCFGVNGSTICAANDSGIVTISNDNGNDWIISKIPQTTKQIWTMAICGKNIFASSDDGLFKSSDNGLSWTQINLGSNTIIQGLTVNGDSIFGAGAGDHIVLLSVDSGATWAPSDSGLICAAYTVFINGKYIFAGTYCSVFLSTDGGHSWQPAHNGIAYYYQRPIYSFTTQGAYIYAAGDGGVNKSSDNGATWYDADPKGKLSTIVNSIISYGGNLFVSVNNGGGGIFKCSDGLNWVGVDSGLYDAVNELVLMGSKIYAGSADKGTYVSYDGGVSWISDNIISNTRAIVCTSENNVIAQVFSGQTGGVFVSNDRGMTWINHNAPGYINSFGTNGNLIFAGYFNASNPPTLTSDCFLTYNNIGNGLKSDYINCFAFSGNTVYVGTGDGVYKSIDNGLTWNSSNSGLTDSNTISSIVVSGQNVFAATNHMYVSIDNGANWTLANDSLNWQETLNLSAIGSTIFASILYDAVYRSADNGANWVKCYQGLTYWPIKFKVVGTKLFVGTNSGVCLSTDMGTTWTSINDGLPPNTSVQYIDATATDLYIGTNAYNGIWRRPLSDVLPCNANFSIYPDTTQLHHYNITDMSYGKQPINYDWSWGDGSHDYTPYPSHTYADSGFYNICLTITDSTGCQSTYCDSSFHAMRTTNTMVYVNVVNPLILVTKGATVQAPQINIFPNPVSNQLIIKATDFPIKKVDIYNVLGQKTSPPTPLQRRGADALIDVSNLSAGIYFVQLSNESSRWVGKFVKE